MYNYEQLFDDAKMLIVSAVPDFTFISKISNFTVYFCKVTNPSSRPQFKIIWRMLNSPEKGEYTYSSSHFWVPDFKAEKITGMKNTE